MKKIVTFICLGNICRSPMAEFLFKKIIQKNANNKYEVLSAGTSGWNDGDDMHTETKKILNNLKIDVSNFYSKKLTDEIFQKSDYIFVMDNQNYKDVIKKFGESKKVKKITDYSTTKKYSEVPDPWYTKNFDETYQILNDALLNIYEKIENNEL
ncbi:MAG: low molecular weight phosphotyrosine protein phosphatase [Malacoplasma sp.]|nr:low molecular weight phosphotyrosine protein phosphatase [Malacoplasma sp.]